MRQDHRNDATGAEEKIDAEEKARDQALEARIKTNIEFFCPTTRHPDGEQVMLEI